MKTMKTISKNQRVVNKPVFNIVQHLAFGVHGYQLRAV